jgi:hypothetical protein
MKKIISALLVSAATTTTALPAMSQTYVPGYYRSNGSYVKPHYRSSPNSTQTDNYSTYGNRNPYTGSYGTKKCGLYNNCN